MGLTETLCAQQGDDDDDDDVRLIWQATIINHRRKLEGLPQLSNDESDLVAYHTLCVRIDNITAAFYLSLFNSPVCGCGLYGSM